MNDTEATTATVGNARRTRAGKGPTQHDQAGTVPRKSNRPSMRTSLAALAIAAAVGIPATVAAAAPPSTLAASTWGCGTCSSGNHNETAFADIP